MNYRRAQAIVLRLVGAVEVLAFGAVVMPRAWMDALHAALGLGTLPVSPVVDSVLRQVSFSYGLHGIALFVIAHDVVRFRPLVILSAIGYFLAAPTFFIIDFILGMPWTWIAGNAGSCLLIGLILGTILLLEHRSNS
jgi:hypothetical protein